MIRFWQRTPRHIKSTILRNSCFSGMGVSTSHLSKGLPFVLLLSSMISFRGYKERIVGYLLNKPSLFRPGYTILAIIMFLVFDSFLTLIIKTLNVKPVFTWVTGDPIITLFIILTTINSYSFVLHSDRLLNHKVILL